MAITINGTANTVAGVAAGGINDNVVDNGTMADDAIGIAELSATGTASSSTFLRGDNTWSQAGGGKILQVVMGTLQGAFTTSSTSYTDIGLSASITPAATANKVLVTVHIGMVGTTTSRAAGFRLYREGSAVTGALGTSGTTENYTVFQYTQNANEVDAGISFQYLDSPSSTSSQEYKVYVKRVMGDANALSINRMITTDAYGAISTMTLMEVEG